MAKLREETLEFADSAPWRFDFRGIVHAPPEAAWSAFADNPSWTIWFKNCTVCCSTSEPPDGVGSTRHLEVNRIRINERFIGWEPGRLWAFTVVDIRPSFATALVERATFEPLDDGRTAITYRMAMEPHTWARPLRPLLATMSKRVFDASFAALDRHLARN